MKNRENESLKIEKQINNRKKYVERNNRKETR